MTAKDDVAVEVTRYVDKRAFLAGRACLTQGWYVYHAPKEGAGRSR